MLKLKPACIFVIVLLGVFFSSQGICANEERKITVSSDRQSIDYSKKILTYQGNVKISWDNYFVEAEKVDVYLAPDNTLDRIVATGGVKISQDKKAQGSCQKLSYSARENTVILEGQVSYLDEMGNTFLAQKITIWIEEKKLEAEGNPVEATYILKEEESGT